MFKIIFLVILCCFCNTCEYVEYRSVDIQVISGKDIKEKEKFVFDVMYFVSSELSNLNMITDFYTSMTYLNKLTVIIYDVEFIDVYPVEGLYVYARASCSEDTIWLGWYHKISLIHEFLHILECRYDYIDGNSAHTGIWWDTYEPTLRKIFFEKFDLSN
jgi:hypothetical protein